MKKMRLQTLACLMFALLAWGGGADAAHKGKAGEDGHHHEQTDPLKEEMKAYVTKPAYRVYLAAMAECTRPMTTTDVNGNHKLDMDPKKLQECMDGKGMPVNFGFPSAEGPTSHTQEKMIEQFKQNIDNIQQVLDEAAAATPAFSPEVVQSGLTEPAAVIEPMTAPALSVGEIPPPVPPSGNGDGQGVDSDAPVGISKAGKSRPAKQFWVPQTKE